MQYRILGRTGLKVSRLGLGTGGPSRLGQSKGVSVREQDALLRRCLELGINLFDTAEHYGRSEEILGRALAGVPRGSYVLATKWGHAGQQGALRAPEELAESIERSLRRLRTDRIDVMQFHGLAADQYDAVVERLYPVMDRFKQQGKIGFIGFSTNSTDPTHDAAIRALNAHPHLWDTIMLKYGILYQSAAKAALPLARQHDVGIINMAAVRLDLSLPDRLAAVVADWKRRGVVPAGSLPDEDPLGWLVHDDVDSVVSAGYKFGASHPAVSTVLTGTANLAHLERNVAAIEKPSLPEPDMRRLKSVFSEIAEGAKR